MASNGLEGKLNDMRWIITAAQYGATPFHKQLDAMERYAKENDAQIGIIPINGQYRDEPLHERIQEYTIIGGDYALSKHLHISQFNINAQHINPLTGLRRFGQAKKSFIVGSPKQQLEHVANSPRANARALMSTGVCTLPHYKDNRIGNIASHDHIQGGLIVEVDDDTGVFYARQFQSKHDGSFIDLSRMYLPKGRSKTVRPEFLVAGDIHEDEIDESAYRAFIQQVQTYKPKRVVLHDIFNGSSINPHEVGKIMGRAQRARHGKLSLGAELYSLGQRLEDLEKHLPKDTTVYVVKSNHDLFLDRYLESGRFTGDPENVQLSVKLAYAMIDGKDPLQTGIKEVYGHLSKRIKFLSLDSDLEVFGWQLGMHGHIGPSGSRGSMNSMEYSLGKGVVAHNHSAAILRQLYRAGTMSILNPKYTDGSTNNWTHSNVLGYSKNQAQVITSINGKYTL